MNRIVKVVTASVLSVSMCGCAVSADEAEATASADAVSSEKKSSEKETDTAYTSEQTGKDETVYVFTGADGSMDHMVVSDTLHTAGKKGAVEDYSSLENIENVSGDEAYSSDDNGNITWTSDGSDISYQGTTDKELPVDVKITYYLDGNEVSADAIKGQSGHVKVHFDYTNNAETQITSNGEQKTVKVPFGMVTGLTLDASKFTNVTVTNGRMNQYNDNDIIYGLALPGLKESLETASVSDIDLTQIDIPEYFEFEADTTDFDIDMCMTVASSNVLSLLNTDDLNVSDFSDSIDELTSSSQQLIDGTKSLKDGTEQLQSGADSLDSGAQSLLDGAGSLSEGASSLSSGTSDLADGAKSLSDGASQVNDGASDLKDGAQSLADGAKSLDDGAESALTGAQSLSDGLKKLSSNSSTLNSSYSQIESGVFTLATQVLESQGISLSKKLDESNYVSVFQTYLGITQALSEDTIKTIASEAGVSEDVAKLLIYMAATNNSGETINSSNLTSKLSEQGTRLSNAQTTNKKLETAESSAKNSPYDNDDAVKKVIEIVRQETIDKITSDAVYNSLIDQINAYAKSNNIPLSEGSDALILAYACEHYDKSKRIDENIASAATLVLSDPYNVELNGTPDSTNKAVSEIVNSIVVEKQYAAQNTSNKDYFTKIVENVITTAANNGQNIDKNTAAVLVVYACENYGDNIMSSSDLTTYVNKASQEMTDAKNVGDAMTAVTSETDTSAATLISGIAAQIAAENKNSNSELNDLFTLLNGITAFKAGLSTYTNGVDSAYAGAQELVKGLDSLKTGADQLNSGAQTLLAGATTLAGGTKSLADGAVSLNDGAAKLKSGAATLYNGSLTLYSGVKTLKDGTASLKTGVVSLDDGAAELEAGMEQFYEEGIKKIADVLGEDLPAVVDSLKGLANAGADYKTYSGALEDDNNTCKFIFKTEFSSEDE